MESVGDSISRAERARRALEKYLGGVRQKSMRRLLRLAVMRRLQYRYGDSSEGWVEFREQTTLDDVKRILGCSERTAWDYLATYRKMSSLL